ncbi:MAG: FAD-dependent oxidoreductase [Nitrososphaerales archaeon]
MQGASELTSVQVDVVIIGGGVQGLVILNELTERRYTCALVTDEDLGGGQTLHSHGFLNTGFGMAGNELPAGAVAIVQPYLLSKGVPVQENWIVLAAPGFPALAGLPPVNLPPGFAPAFAEAARKLPDRSLDKQQLVEVLARDRMDRVIRGTVAGFRGRNPVEAVVVQPQGSAEMLELQARAVVVAAGCGSKKLLAGLAGAAPQLDAIKHRLVHMVCVRAPRGALPAVSVAALPLGLLLAAHEDADWVTWYVTPMEFGGPSFDDVPNDASAGTLPAMLARAAAAVLKLYPSLPDTLGLRVGHYAGYRQDIGDMPGVRMCQVAAGTGNVVAALPSGLIGSWLNAADALALLDGLIGPATRTGDRGPLPWGGEGVRVGRPVEDRPGFEWQTWEQWHQLLPQPPTPA